MLQTRTCLEYFHYFPCIIVRSYDHATEILTFCSYFNQSHHCFADLQIRLILCERWTEGWNFQMILQLCNRKKSNELDFRLYLNYYLSYDVCACFRLSECLSFCKKKFSSKMDQIRKFGEQTSRILEFKPEGLDF